MERLSKDWISIKDELPKDREKVICLEDYRIIGKTYVGTELYFYRENIGFVHFIDDEDPYGLITHWYPCYIPEVK